MPLLSIRRLQGSGALLLASYFSATLGCASPYEPEGQFWSTAPSVGLGAGEETAADDPTGSGASGDATGATEGTPPDEGTSSDPRLDEGGTPSDTPLDNGTGGGVGSVPSAAGNAAGASNATGTSNAAATQGSGGSSAGAGGATAAAGGTGAVTSPSVVVADSPTCSLDVSVTTTAPGKKYKPRNVGAVWVADSSGKFLKSLEVWGNKRIRAVKAWNAATQAAGLSGNKVDAVTSATLSTHRTHELTWDCRDARDQVMPDSTYRVYFEVADDDSGGPNHFETFTKGPATTTVQGSATNFNNISLTFTP